MWFASPRPQIKERPLGPPRFLHEQLQWNGDPVPSANHAGTRRARSRRATLRPVAGLPVSVEPPVGRDLGYIRNDRPRVHAEFQNASRVNRLDLPGVRRRFHDAPRN